MSVMTVKAQVTIPKEIREVTGLAPGDEIEFDVEGGKVVLHRKVNLGAIEKYRGYLGKATTRDIMEDLR